MTIRRNKGAGPLATESDVGSHQALCSIPVPAVIGEHFVPVDSEDPGSRVELRHGNMVWNLYEASGFADATRAYWALLFHACSRRQGNRWGWATLKMGSRNWMGSLDRANE